MNSNHPVNTVVDTSSEAYKADAYKEAQQASNSQKNWASLLKPQVLIPLLLCILALLSLLRQPRLAAPQPIAIVASEQAEPTKTETIELTLYDALLLERPSFKDLSLSQNDTDRLSEILQALKTELAIWPANLDLPIVYVAEIEGRKTAVLDFFFDTANSTQISSESSASTLNLSTLNLSVNDEWRLLKSIISTLERNGFNNWHVLKNHQESNVFLRYIDPTALK